MGRKRKPRLGELRISTEGKPTYELTPEQKAMSNMFGIAGRNPADREVMEPPANKRITKDGGWAMIIRKLPPIEKGFQGTMRVGRVFYIEHTGEADDAGFTPGGKYKVLCNSPWGSVCLWPYEYSVMDTTKLFSLWESKELIFHPLAENVRFSDALHYVRSRGVSLEDAMVMVLGTLKGPVGWFEPAPGLSEQCEEMEERVHRWEPTRTLKEPMEVTLSVNAKALED